MQVWDSNVGKSVFKFPAKKHVNHISMSSAAAAHGSPLHTVCAVATTDKEVSLLDLRIGSAIATLAAHEGTALQCSWSKVHAHRLASAASDGTVYIWDARRSGLDACVGQLDHKQHERRQTGGSSSTAAAAAAINEGRRLPNALKQRILAQARGDLGHAAPGGEGPVGFAFHPHTHHTAHAGSAASVTFLPSHAGSTEAMLTSGSDSTVRLWCADTAGGGNSWQLQHTARASIASHHKLGCQPAAMLLPATMGDTQTGRNTASNMDVYVLHPNSCAPTTGAGGAIGTGDSTGGVSVLNLSKPDQVVNLWGGHIGTVTHVATHAAQRCVYTAGQDGSVVCRKLRPAGPSHQGEEAAEAAAAAWGDLL